MAEAYQNSQEAVVQVWAREMPFCCALESKTTLIWPGFGDGRLRRSASTNTLLHSSGGAGSAWLLSKFFFMKAMNCSFISGLLSKLRRSELRRVSACSRLLGRGCLGILNGRRSHPAVCVIFIDFFIHNR